MWGKRKRNQPEMYEKAIQRSPFKRLGTAAEAANAVVFLASPAASYVSGTNLMVDGSSTTRVRFQGVLKVFRRVSDLWKEGRAGGEWSIANYPRIVLSEPVRNRELDATRLSTIVGRVQSSRVGI